MKLSQQVLQRILISGGGLRLSAKGMPPAALLDLAHAARDGEAQLIIELDGASLKQDFIIKIAAAGGSAVLFDMSTVEKGK